MDDCTTEQNIQSFKKWFMRVYDFISSTQVFEQRLDLRLSDQSWNHVEVSDHLGESFHLNCLFVVYFVPQVDLLHQLHIHLIKYWVINFFCIGL